MYVCTFYVHLIKSGRIVIVLTIIQLVAYSTSTRGRVSITIPFHSDKVSPNQVPKLNSDISLLYNFYVASLYAEADLLLPVDSNSSKDKNLLGFKPCSHEH